MNAGVATINGPGILTNASGKTLVLDRSTVNAPFVNSGALIARNDTKVNGSFSSVTGSSIRVEGDPNFIFCCGDAELTFASGFSNNGLIELTSVNGAARSALTVTSGTLVNSAGSTISVLTGSGGIRRIQVQIDNQGSVTAAPALTIVGDFSNGGALTPGGGGIGCINLDGHYTQTGAGALNIDISSASGACTGHDQVTISGTATLAGALNVTLLGGFDPGTGQGFSVLIYGSHAGDFTYRLPAGQFLSPVPGSADLTLTGQ